MAFSSAKKDTSPPWHLAGDRPARRDVADLFLECRAAEDDAASEMQGSRVKA